ncbi:hypothetical protein CBL_08407 [Carabus blaptoides fortunei]
MLIEYYAKYKRKVGILEMRYNTALWKRIAEEFLKINIKVSGNNCQNRWKVLERNYKKFVDNQYKTGRGCKHFEYEKEMREIVGKKKNVHPEILLSTETEDHILIPEEEINVSSVDSEEIENAIERKNIETPTREQRVHEHLNQQLHRQSHFHLDPEYLVHSVANNICKPAKTEI